MLLRGAVGLVIADQQNWREHGGFADSGGGCTGSGESAMLEKVGWGAITSRKGKTHE